MNYYWLFYLLTVADGLKSFFDVFSNICTWLAVISLIIFVILIFVSNDPQNSDESTQKSMRFWIGKFRSIFITLFIFTILTWAGYVAVPTKKDAIIIIAGGAVGNYLSSDSNAKQLPSEIFGLLRAKIKEEIAEASSDNVKDTLEAMTKEQLIQLVKDKK